MKKEQKLIKKLLKHKSNYKRTIKLLNKYDNLLENFTTLLTVEKNFQHSMYLNNNNTRLKLINCKTLLTVDKIVYVVRKRECPFIYEARVIKVYKNGNVDLEAL